MEDTLNKLKESVVGIKFPKSTKYVVVCLVSISQIKRWDKESIPNFMKGNKPTQTIYLMPEVSHKLSERDEVQKCADRLSEIMGEDFVVDVCAIKNDLIIGDNNFITL